MPTVRKLSPDEVRSIEKRIKGQRRMIEEEYDRFFEGYTEGDYGEAELNEGENRITVRNRLKAAAQRKGLSLDFKRTKGNVLRFKVLPGSQNGSMPEENELLSAPPAPEPEPEQPKRRGRRRKTE